MRYLAKALAIAVVTTSPTLRPAVASTAIVDFDADDGVDSEVGNDVDIVGCVGNDEVYIEVNDNGLTPSVWYGGTR